MQSVPITTHSALIFPVLLMLSVEMVALFVCFFLSFFSGVFVSDLQQVGGFLRGPPPIKLTTTI
jgi:hypothetical protein